MKHTSWLSGFAGGAQARDRPAMPRTSRLRQLADGQAGPGPAGPGRACAARTTGPWPGRHRAGATTARRARRRRGRGGRWRRRRSPAARPASRSRSNLRWRLHSTQGFGVRPAGVIGDVRIDDVAFELLGEVEDVVGDPELLGDPPGVLDVGYRAAASVGWPTPELHGGSDHLLAGVDQECSRHRRVDAAGHGDQHPHSLTLRPVAGPLRPGPPWRPGPRRRRWCRRRG